VIANIATVAHVAINDIVSVADEVGNVFEDGFNIVVGTLTQFGNDIANGFLQTAD